VNLRRSSILALVASATVLALAGCGKSTSVTAVDTTDTTPPNPPTNLHSAWAQGVNQDYLYWSPSTSPSVHGYEVWESTTLGGTATQIATVNGASISDVVLPTVTSDVTRYFQVRAKSNGGAFSAYSAALAVDLHAMVPVAGNPTGDPNPGIGSKVPD
jgi:hypothetical protein